MTHTFRLSLLLLVLCTMLSVLGLLGCADALVLRGVRSEVVGSSRFLGGAPSAVERHEAAENAFTGTAPVDPSGVRENLSNLAPFRVLHRAENRQEQPVRRY